MLKIVSIYIYTGMVASFGTQCANLYKDWEIKINRQFKQKLDRNENEKKIKYLYIQ